MKCMGCMGDGRCVLWRCSAVAYNEHCADMAPAQLRVGGVLYVDDPASHQHTQPCHHQVLQLNCRQTGLSTNSKK